MCICIKYGYMEVWGMKYGCMKVWGMCVRSLGSWRCDVKDE